MDTINLHNYEAYLLDHIEGNLGPAQLKELLAFIALHPELEIDLNDLSFPVLEKNTIQAGFKEDLLRHSSYVSTDTIIDYLEGNLTQNEKKEFENKFAADKSLAREVTLFKSTLLIPDKNTVFSERSKLFKNDEAYVLNHTAIAYLENDLSADEQFDFEKLLISSEKSAREFDQLKKTILVPDQDIVYDKKHSLKKQNTVLFLFRVPAMASMAAAILLLLGMYMVFTTFIQTDSLNSKLSQAPQGKTNSPQTLSEANQPSIAALAPVVSQLKTIQSEGTTHHLATSSSQSQKENMANTIADSVLIDKLNQTPALNSLIEKQVSDKISATELNEENKAAIAGAIQSELIKLKSLPEVEDEEEELVAEVPSKNKFWKKAVKIAQRVNNLGLKSINGAQSSKDQYLLSFNSFSIEKK